ncbi:MAG: hypothetical protein Q8N05_21325 [Bacteroidota bacterium]|nr:hypothetical protein [Bacteroidota bacterium]
MATDNYDMLIQLDEKLLNKAMAMVYYTGFLKFEGDYNLIKGAPDELLGFTQFHYKLSLKSEPFVDLRTGSDVFLRFSGEIKLVVLTGVPIHLDVEFSVLANVVFDMGVRHLNYEVKEVRMIKLTLNDKIQFNKKFIAKLNEIFGILLNDYFKNDVKVFEIPFALHNIELPMMPDTEECKLPVSRIDVKILNNRTLAVGINFFTTTPTGSISGNYTSGKEIYIAIKNKTLTDTFNFWWDKTSFNKTKEFDGSTALNFDATIEKGIDVATRILSIGFIESDTNYENMVLAYGGTIKVTGKPEFEFLTGNSVKIKKLIFNADLFANMSADVIKEINLDTSSFIPDKITPWKDDVHLKSINKPKKSLLDLKNVLDLEIIDAEGRMTLNEQNNLVIKIEKADFEIDFHRKGTAFSKRIWDKLMTFIKERVVEKIPEIVISPSLVLSKVNVYGFTGSILNSSIEINPEEVNFTTDLVINELKNLPVAVPNYIANKKSKTIHKFDCSFVGDIDPENRIGYFVIYEALSEQYKTCKSCLNAYHIY